MQEAASLLEKTVGLVGDHNGAGVACAVHGENRAEEHSGRDGVLIAHDRFPVHKNNLVSAPETEGPAVFKGVDTVSHGVVRKVFLLIMAQNHCEERHTCNQVDCHTGQNDNQPLPGRF